MSNDINSSNLDEQRRRKAENFRLNIHDNDIQSDSSNQPPAEEITSYSGQDVKEQIAKESKRSLKKKKKAEKRELKSGLKRPACNRPHGFGCSKRKNPKEPLA